MRKNAQETLEQVTENAEEHAAKNTAVETRPEYSQFDYEALQNSYQRMEIEFQKQTVLIGQLNGAMEEKDSQNDRLNHQVCINNINLIKFFRLRTKNIKSSDLRVKFRI